VRFIFLSITLKKTNDLLRVSHRNEMNFSYEKRTSFIPDVASLAVVTNCPLSSGRKIRLSKLETHS
jgi:hypothetical protein